MSKAAKLKAKNLGLNRNNQFYNKYNVLTNRGTRAKVHLPSSPQKE